MELEAQLDRVAPVDKVEIHPAANNRDGACIEDVESGIMLMRNLREGFAGEENRGNAR